MFLNNERTVSREENESIADESLRLCICSENAEKYFLDVTLENTVENIIDMSVAHFFKPFDNYLDNPNASWCNKDCYRLVLVKNLKTLTNESTLRMERLLNNDQILLVKIRKLPQNYIKSAHFHTKAVDNKQIQLEQIVLKSRELRQNPMNHDREANPMDAEHDFKIDFRRITLTMIETSIHLISPDNDAADQFVLIFEHLIKRHKPRVDKETLCRIMNMGFPEAKAIKSLQLKTTYEKAIEWLVEESDKSVEDDKDILSFSTPQEKRDYFFSGNDPTAIVMKEFNKYIEKWFVPDSKSVASLKSLGYKESEVIEALKISCNFETIAKEILRGNDDAIQKVVKGLDRDAPIMSAILNSSVVQAALVKPKTLYALMVLCEAPNNVNVWLSDPETHSVVSQILKTYHAEKHRMDDDQSDMIIEEELLVNDSINYNTFIYNISSMPPLQHEF